MKQLYKITKSEIYFRMENCLGSHWAMNLIALGLYVLELNKNQQTELQGKIRKNIHRKYGVHGLRILEMGSTGAIKNIIDYLSNLKMRKDYNIIQMGKVFDKIIRVWKEITIFITKDENLRQVQLRCSNMLVKKPELFFVFASGSAVYSTINTIAKLHNDNELEDYIFDAKMDRLLNENNQEIDFYSCYFEKATGFGIDMFA